MVAQRHWRPIAAGECLTGEAAVLQHPGSALCKMTGGYIQQKETKASEAKGEAAVAIVDPYSSGRYLVYELHKRGIPIVCVRSSLKLGDFFLGSYATHKEYYVSTVDHGGDVESTASALLANESPFRMRS